MNILVIGSNKTNVQAALAQLPNHNTRPILVESPDDYAMAYRAIEHGYNVGRPFEAVFIEQWLPSHSGTCPDDARFLSGREPSGINLVLAAMKYESRYIILFADDANNLDFQGRMLSGNMLGIFNPDGEGYPEPFTVGGSKILVTNNSCWISQFQPDLKTPAQHLVDSGHLDEASTVRTKNWKACLNYLILWPKVNVE
ncbi:MAG: hypothetical protein WCL61_00465 [bacterium]